MAISNRIKYGAIGAAVLAAAVTTTTFLLPATGIVNARTGQGYDNLQAAIDAAQSGDTLNMNGVTAICNCVENKGLIIAGPGVVKTPNSIAALYYPPATPPAKLKGLEITTSSGPVSDIVRYGISGPEQDTDAELPQGLTIEECDIHGQPGQEVKRGVAANGANFVIRNSRVREIHGLGYDTQAICGWNSPGPFLIEDNELQAAGENVMFGGADPSIPNLVPSDITIRRNRFWKDPAWLKVWTVKNLLETKNARRVMVDGNVFENIWPDAQVGFAILLKSNNQDSTAPWSVTEDVVFSNNIVRNAEHGLNILGTEYPPKVSGVTKRIKIINNFWDVRRIWLQITRGGEDIQLSHNTFVTQDGNTAVFGDSGEPTVKGFVLRDNIGVRAGYGVKGDGTAEGTPTLNTWTPGWAMTGNVLADQHVQSPITSVTYPSGNAYPASLAAIGFVDLAGGNYRLAASSPYKGKATDGKDPGVDWDALEAAQGKPPSQPSPTASATPTATATQTPVPSPTLTPSPTPTVAPVPSPSSLPKPSPSPTATPLPICAPNQVVGSPPKCRCTTMLIGNPKRCKP